ncbi:MAG: hypothetical protein D6754_04100 [Alphaproteobacteria bacterium]|nr:MAG: hypothetical protein D6754_04100 [Alphaproteobacteria bacterium]
MKQDGSGGTAALGRRGFLAGGLAVLAAGPALASTIDTRGRLLAKCGKIEIREMPDGQIGIFHWEKLKPNPEPIIAPLSNPRWVLTASFKDRLMELHEKQGDKYVARGIWPVVTPAPWRLGGQTVHGRAYKVEMQPSWYPSASLRRKYNLYRVQNPEENAPPLPPGAVPYGHPGNPMGERKIRFRWFKGHYMPSAVLHGTGGYPVQMCTEETSGCVRLYNDWIVKLVTELGGPNTIEDGVEMILTPRSL